MKKTHKEFAKDTHDVITSFIPYYQNFVNLYRYLRKWIYDDNKKGISIKQAIKKKR